MSLLSKNIIPGNYGKVFSTNAKDENDLKRIKKKVQSLKGIKEVKINTEVFPREFTVYTSELVKVDAIEDKIKLMGFHAIPKNLFPL